MKLISPKLVEDCTLKTVLTHFLDDKNFCELIKNLFAFSHRLDFGHGILARVCIDRISLAAAASIEQPKKSFDKNE